jgi:excinuclease ABC subunit A
LHARDNEQLLAALATLKRRGNSLVVVEHDEQTMRHADYIIDLGPGAGIHGGKLVAGGTLRELMRHGDSVTGRWLRLRRKFPSRGERRPVTVPAASDSPKREHRTSNIEPRTSNVPSPVRGSELDVRRSTFSDKQAPTGSATCLILNGARKNNLKTLSVAIPLNRLVAVAGVSGSGKSTLVRECLVPALQSALAKDKSTREQDAFCGLKGHESIKAVYEVDQSPIGRTPRSIPATYVGFFDDIRRLFSETPEARLRGYSPSRFSFNSAQGRCPACEGAGTIKLEMSFMPSAYVRCETCNGSRYNGETLVIQYRGKTIAQILDLSVAEAIDFFSAIQKIRRPLEALRDTGLDYLRLGQISPTLSGGEAQRLKLVTHLLSGFSSSAERRRGELRSSFFVLEEPTIGLHMADVSRLVEVLQRLVDAGHSVLVIEHNLDLIAEADWVIDLGPEGGAAGGQVVAQGTPEQIARIPRSHTGRFLRNVLAN